MTRITILLALLITVIACKDSQKIDTSSDQIINAVIEYHKTLVDINAEVFPKTGDTILYQDFKVIPLTSRLTELIRKDSKLLLSLNGMTSKNTEFEKYLSLSDSLFVQKQITNNVSRTLDTSNLSIDFIPYFQEFESYFQADSIINKYNKDLIFFDTPIFNSERNVSIITYVYTMKSYLITNIVRLEKDSENNNWQLNKQYGLVTKYFPENNDWDNDSVYYTMFIGSMNK